MNIMIQQVMILLKDHHYIVSQPLDYKLEITTKVAKKL
jgi:hypothetical protein